MASLAYYAFYIKRENILARTFLSLTCTFSILFIFINIGQSVVITSYLKSVDIFLFFCMFMTIFTFIQSVFVSWLQSGSEGTEKENLQQHCGVKAAKYIDIFSRIFYPIIFVVVTVVYIVTGTHIVQLDGFILVE